MVRHSGERVVIIFEGRDAAGKGGVINRISAPLNSKILSGGSFSTRRRKRKVSGIFKGIYSIYRQQVK